jgi:hypothetical protein
MSPFHSVRRMRLADLTLRGQNVLTHHRTGTPRRNNNTYSITHPASQPPTTTRSDRPRARATPNSLFGCRIISDHSRANACCGSPFVLPCADGARWHLHTIPAPLQSLQNPIGSKPAVRLHQRTVLRHTTPNSMWMSGY